MKNIILLFDSFNRLTAVYNPLIYAVNTNLKSKSVKLSFNGFLNLKQYCTNNNIKCYV